VLVPGFCFYVEKGACDCCGANDLERRVLRILCPEPKDYPTNELRLCIGCIHDEFLDPRQLELELERLRAACERVFGFIPDTEGK